MDQRKSNSAPSVVVGVGAGIAAYKVAILVREFKRFGWDVHVVPTSASLNFVGVATWAELSENPVVTDVFDEAGPGHIHLAAKADLVVVAPATADLLARIRAGMANDLLTTTVLATSAPVLLVPAMHSGMWLSAATKENIAVLQERGFHVMQPEVGNLSSGDSGIGRMPEPEQIAATARSVLAETPQAGQPSGKFLEGRSVVVTAGGTHEPLDPVRFIGNRSTGHQGIAIATAAAAAGANVALIVANTTAPLPPESPSLKIVHVQTSRELERAVQDKILRADCLIMAAAVADFRPKKIAANKIKKLENTDEISISLVKTTDILKTVSTSPARPTVLVGFGAETGTTDDVLALGSEKAVAKRADLLAVNKVGASLGFGNVPNHLYYFDAKGELIGQASGTKSEVATDLLTLVADLLAERS